MIQGGVCGKMPSCILFSGIFDSCRDDIIRRLKVLLFFLFFQSVACISGCLYFISLVGLARFQLCRVLESQFFMS